MEIIMRTWYQSDLLEGDTVEIILLNKHLGAATEVMNMIYPYQYLQLEQHLVISIITVPPQAISNFNLRVQVLSRSQLPMYWTCNLRYRFLCEHEQHEGRRVYRLYPAPESFMRVTIKLLFWATRICPSSLELSHNFKMYIKSINIRFLTKLSAEIHWSMELQGREINSWRISSWIVKYF